MDEKVTPETETQNVSSNVSDCDNSSIDLSMETSSETSSEDPEKWMDVLSNGQLKKKVIIRGEKGIQPCRGDICKVKIFGVLDNGTLVEEHVDVSIQVGDLEVVQGLDITIQFMELNEVAEIVVNPILAYGARGTYIYGVRAHGVPRIRRIPPNATITYTVELKGIEEEPEIETLSISKRKEIGIKKRERGDWWFRRDLSLATKCYRRALQYLVIDNDVNDTRWNKNKETETVTDTELQALLDECIKVYNNIATVLIETDAYDRALKYVNQVLNHQPCNTSALYKKERILKYQGEYGKAYMIFLEALMIEPGSIAVNLELASLREKISRENEKEKYRYAKKKYLYAKTMGININKDGSIDKPLPNNEKVEDKSKIAKGMMWTLLGASAVVVGILVDRFAS